MLTLYVTHNDKILLNASPDMCVTLPSFSETDDNVIANFMEKEFPLFANSKPIMLNVDLHDDTIFLINIHTTFPAILDSDVYKFAPVEEVVAHGIRTPDTFCWNAVSPLPIEKSYRTMTVKESKSIGRITSYLRDIIPTLCETPQQVLLRFSIISELIGVLPNGFTIEEVGTGYRVGFTHAGIASSGWHRLDQALQAYELMRDNVYFYFSIYPAVDEQSRYANNNVAVVGDNALITVGNEVVCMELDDFKYVDECLGAHINIDAGVPHVTYLGNQINIEATVLPGSVSK